MTVRRFEEWISAQPVDSKIALIFVDLDGFNKLNDQIGIAAGDRCLKLVGQAISEIVDVRGDLYRVMGDQFTLFLGEEVDAGGMAEQLRQEIAMVGKPFGVTASIGAISILKEFRNKFDAESIASMARRACRSSKLKGKNRVTFANPIGLRHLDEKDLAELDLS